VVDAAGRIVRIVRAARLEAGEHVLRWDGRNARGAPTPPGVYFLELRTEAGGTSTRVVRIQ
jgi:flagellar hook assembly protein FlgD